MLTTQDASGSQSLVLAGRDGKVTQTLAQPDGQVAFAWSPQGGSLAYSNLTLTNAVQVIVLGPPTNRMEFFRAVQQ